jgi:hypothetical protein
MSVREILQKQIQELEEKIASAKSDKTELEIALARLKLQDFEEDLKNTQEQQLLKG